MKRKICVVVTARPSYSRIKTALRAIADHPQLELQLVVAASALLDRYGSAVKVMERDGFVPAARVFNVVEGENLVAAPKTTAMGILELTTVFLNLQPDIVVTVADRYETMATAIAAAYMNIPLAHVQGGEVTGNIDEKVRHAVTKLADYHFVASDAARERVLRLGEDAGAVFNTGCPSIDLARQVARESRGMLFDPYAKYGGVGEVMDLSDGYLVVLQHPVTTEPEQARRQVEATLDAVNDFGLPTLWFWPNLDAGGDATSGAIRAFRENRKPAKIHFFKNMEPEDFLRLLLGAKCLVGNSSVGIRECSYLGVPAVNIGSRQQRRDRGRNVVDVAPDTAAIRSAIEHSLATPRPEPDNIYGGGDAGARIADLLATVPLRFHKTIAY
jgi:UDP-hydrolysing UDP-N-acetyl-D-glucosamine 2-epimerase